MFTKIKEWSNPICIAAYSIAIGIPVFVEYRVSKKCVPDGFVGLLTS